VVLLLNYSYAICKLQVYYWGYRKHLWSSLYYEMLAVLQKVTLGHIDYGRSPVMEYHISDIVPSSTTHYIDYG
jgi:hypothetical protein